MHRTGKGDHSYRVIRFYPLPSLYLKKCFHFPTLCLSVFGGVVGVRSKPQRNHAVWFKGIDSERTHNNNPAQHTPLQNGVAHPVHQPQAPLPAHPIEGVHGGVVVLLPVAEDHHILPVGWRLWPPASIDGWVRQYIQPHSPLGAKSSPSTLPCAAIRTWPSFFIKKITKNYQNTMIQTQTSPKNKNKNK